MHNIFNKKLSDGTLLLISILFANFLNFVFNVYLGRVLSFESFGLIALINTFLYLALIFFNSLSATVNQKTAYLYGQNKQDKSMSFLTATNKRNYLIGVFASLIWILLIPFTDSFFHINNVLIPLLFTPVIVIGLITAANRGYLQGIFNFKLVALIILIESVAKLVIAYVLVELNLKLWVYTSIPLSLLTSFLLSLWIISKKTSNEIKVEEKYIFPKKFFIAATITGFSSLAYLTFDLLLIKHFMSPTQAGQYAFLSLIGKMIYFVITLPNVFIITLISSNQGNKLDSTKVFYKLFSAVIILGFISFIVLGLFGKLIVPILFGAKTIVIVPYLAVYSGAMTLFAITSSAITFHLARENYLFSLIAILMAVLMSLGITLFHSNISQVTYVIFWTSLLNLLAIGLLHFFVTHQNLNIKKGWL